MFSVDKAEPFYWGRLRYTSEREAYSRIRSAMMRGSTSVEVEDLRLTAEMLLDVNSAIYMDDPMLFHCRMDSWDHIDGIAMEVFITQYYTEAARSSMRRAIEDALSDAYYGCLCGVPDLFTAESAVLGWLKANVVYDIKEADDRIPEYEYRSVVGALVHRKGVCSSISKAASIMLKACGFRVICVTGTSQGEGHMWNAVRTPSGWLHSDFTFALGADDVTYLDMDDRSCAVDHEFDIDFRDYWARSVSERVLRRG